MSTSDEAKAALDAVTSTASGSAHLAKAAGLPDPAELARLANQFFQALPGAASVPTRNDAAGIPSVSALNTTGFVPSVPPVALAAPDEEALKNIPAQLGIKNPPGFPGGFSLDAISTTPSFSFIHDARSILSHVPAAPVHAVPVSPSSFSSISAPQLPQAVVRQPESTFTSSLSFLEQNRSLMPAVEALAPEVAASASTAPSAAFDVHAVRRDFPALQERINGKPLIWLDNAATTHKPQSVIDRIAHFYAHENSNIHRAAHTMAARATDAYEAAREKTRRFLNASSTSEIVFVRGATEAINFVAQSWGRRHIGAGDEIIVSHLEHHANIVPWQMLCSEKGAKLRVAPVDDHGQILLDAFEGLFNAHTRLVAITHVSNALGTIAPVAEMTEIAHRHGAVVLIDGAQAVSHMPVNVQELGCDFYVFSGHKVFGPTGIGVVFGTADIFKDTPPWQGGGNMIVDVTFERTTYQPPPGRFEAGTGNIADAVGLGAAFDYLERIGMASIARYEHHLLAYGIEQLRKIPGLRLIGTAREKASVLSFVLDGFRPEDIGVALNREGIAVRAGHHCAQPILRRYGLESTVRPSLAFYNTCDEIDALVAAIHQIKGGRTGAPR